MSGAWLYAWQGVDPDGNASAGHLLGRNKMAVRKALIEHNLQPLNVRIVGYIGRGYWRKQQLAAMMAQLASVLGAGLPLRESLAVLAEDHPRAGWRCLLRLLSAKIEQGLTLSQALADFPHIFPPVYCAMMALGELTGRLDRCCHTLAEQEARLDRLTKSVLAALRYPLFILFMAAAVIGLMMMMVLPEFAGLYAQLDAPLPASTRRLLGLAEHAGGIGLTVLMFAIVLYGGYRRVRHRYTALRHHALMWLLYLPGLGALIRQHNLYLLFQSLAMTHPAGITLDNSLEVAAHTLSHPGYRQAVLGLRRHIQRGYDLHQAFYRHRLFPPHCHQLIKTGEFSGTLEQVFRQLSLMHEQRTQQLTDALAQMAEPLLLLILGGIVCALMMMLYLPLMQLGEVFGHY